MSDTTEGRALLAKSVGAHDSGDWFAESYQRQAFERYLVENAPAMFDALDAVERVCVLHKRGSGFYGARCDYCTDISDSHASWPCPTIEALGETP